MLPVKIAGLGYHLPERRVTTSDLLNAWSVPEGLVEHAAGVYARRYATTETTAGMAAMISTWWV